MSLWKSSFYLIFLVTLVSSAFALDVNDKVQATILKMYEENVIVMTRGLEDGIEQGDHVKLISPDGYAARAICIKAGLVSSYWKLYRIVNSDLVSKDIDYTLVAIQEKEVDPYYAGFKNQDLSSQLPDVDPKSPVQIYQKATTDLPTTLEDDPAVVESQKTNTQQFMDKNFDAEQFGRDFSSFTGSVFASPYSEATYDKQTTKNLSYGISLNNNAEKYYFNTYYRRSELKAPDYNGGETITLTDRANVTFNVDKITPKWDFFMALDYTKMRRGDIFPIKSDISGSIFGLKYRIYEGETLKKFDISYSPMIQNRTAERQEYNYTTGKTEIVEIKNQNLRHSWRLRMYFQLTENLSVSNVTWYRPNQSMVNWHMDWADQLFSNEFMISQNISKSITFDYTNNYGYDITQKRNSGVNPFTKTNTFNLRWNFQI